MEMNAVLEKITRPSSSAQVREKTVAVLALLAGLNVTDAVEVLRSAGAAVDLLSVMPTLDS